MSKLTAKILRDSMGISRSYAFAVVSRARQPSIKLALKIFDLHGEKFGLLENLSKEEITNLEEKWVHLQEPDNG